MSTNTNGKKLYDACLRAGMTGKGFDLLDDESRQCFEQAAAEYDKARAQLPDDVEAFVAEADARSVLIPRHDSETWEAFVAEVVTGHERVGGMVAEVVGFVGIESDAAAALSHAPNDAQRLIAIIRAQGAELAKNRAERRKDLSEMAQLADALDGVRAAIGQKSLTDAAVPAAVTAIVAEREALRDRFTKLEKLGRDVASHYVPESECECDACVAGRQFADLLGVGDNGTTQTNEERKQ